MSSTKKFGPERQSACGLDYKEIKTPNNILQKVKQGLWGHKMGVSG